LAFSERALGPGHTKLDGTNKVVSILAGGQGKPVPFARSNQKKGFARMPVEMAGIRGPPALSRKQEKSIIAK